MADPRDEDAPDDRGHADRTPPHNLEAEQSALGGMLLSKNAVDDVLEVARGVDFYLPKHEVIFTAIATLHRKGEPVDPITVADELTKTGQLQRAGGAEYLHTLTSMVPTAANAGYWGQIVADQAILRRLVEAGTRIVQMGYASEGEPRELVDTARTEVDNIGMTKRAPLRMIGDGLLGLVEMLEAKPTYLSTPWPSIDTLIGGFAPGELTVVASRPGEGKTVMLVQTALHAARHGVVAFCSFEMKYHELQLRMIAQRGGVHMTALRNHTLTEIDWHNFNDARVTTEKAPLFIDDSGAQSSATVSDIRAHARAVRKRGSITQTPLSAIFVDYLQLVKGSGADRRLEIDGVSRALKQLAQELDVPVIVAAQLNRGQPGRGGVRPEPTLRDLRESGGIEQDADAVLLLHRPGEKWPRYLDVIVAKNRHGSQGKISLRWEAEYARVVDRDWRQKLWGDDTEQMQ